MLKKMRRGLVFVLALIMVAGLLPVSASAAVDSTGKPTNLENKIVLSIYTTEGTFPGEPATHGSSEYISFNSNFQQTSASGTFKNSADTELDPSILNPGVLVQGAASGSNTVWGVFSAEGLNQYFLPTATITQDANEAKIIRSIKGISNDVSDADVLKQYEIIWYVIKLQHSASGWWWNSTTEWHIDGLIKERKYISINYYGNGNTGGAAPDGTTTHTAGEPYTILGKNTLVKKEGRVDLAFLGWSARADGTGAEVAFYQPGHVIEPTQSLSLYAMWDTTTQYTATVNTYLDNVLTDDKDIHGTERSLSLGTLDGGKYYYYDLTRNSEGVYTVNITGNGKFHLYSKNADGTYTQIGTHQLTIYNQNGSLDVHHYSVQYDANGGAFAKDPGKQVYNYGDAVTAVTDIPTMAGYRFVCWKDGNGNAYQPGDEITASIDKPITLTAQWEKTINVTVNVTINHVGGNGYDQMESKDEVNVALVSRANNDSPYLETGHTLELVDSTVTTEQTVTTYTGNTFADMPGGEVDYTVVTSKSGYDTKITPSQDSEGNWIIDVKMVYKPTNFDLKFTVEVDPKIAALGEAYIPEAAIVKVTFWSTDRSQWETITQQENDLPGVRVDLSSQGKGEGTYPVWKYESSENGTENPYGYRVEVTSFVYPDGTIVPVSKEPVTKDVAWTDNVYTATVDPVTGGKTYGTLGGAYFEGEQKGTLNVQITMDLHKVTFDAQGGKVNGLDPQVVENQYKIPGFKAYTPTRDGGYTFAGWYLDEACTEPAVEGTDLTQDITLYAKWIEPLTVSGTVSISGTYLQDGKTVSVHDIDRATEAVVVLQEVRNGKAYDVDSKTVTFGSYEDSGSADYSFTGIPNDGKSYQIHVLVLNYGTGYDNESDSNSDFTEKEFTAVFGVDTTADVDAHLTFVPPSYDQNLKVDATQIGEKFRPKSVLSEVMYRDVGDNHPFQRISQHDVTPFGVQIGLNNGLGEGKQSIWKWHTDGTLYDYQMNITAVDGNTYDSDTAPFDIVYAEPAYWDDNGPSGDLKATLIPKQYLVTFDLNAGTDVVTGIEKLTYTDEDGNTVTTDIYGVIHTWSFDTAITAVPQREGYNFLGWEADAGLYGDGKIPAAVHQEVTLIAQWEKIGCTVTTSSNPKDGGTTTGDGTYDYGREVTLTATAEPGYTFVRWLENGTFVSNQATYTIEKLTANRQFVAEFSRDAYEVEAEADPVDGGNVTVSGNGTFSYGEEAEVTATANPGYTFVGWYENGVRVSTESAYKFTVTGDHSLVAKFDENPPYLITTISTEGGTTEGNGTYKAGTIATVKATTNPEYTFFGWYEDGELVSSDAEYSFEVTKDRELKAEFAKGCTVTTTADPEAAANKLEGAGTYKSGTTITLKAEAKDGYCFVGWYDENGKLVENPTITVLKDRTFTAKFVAKTSYQCDYVYIFGYNDTQIGAEGSLLRGELAQMIYRLVKQNTGASAGNHIFSDTAGEWFRTGISYMATKGAIDKTAPSANPYVAVTRGETYKMLCLGLNFTDDTSLRPSQYAKILESHGYNTPEGSVNASIVRWEFCQLFNDILGRSDYCNNGYYDTYGNEVTAETYNYTDLKPSDPYYRIMMIATSTFDKEGRIDVEHREKRNVLDEYGG